MTGAVFMINKSFGMGKTVIVFNVKLKILPTDVNETEKDSMQNANLQETSINCSASC